MNTHADEPVEMVRCLLCGVEVERSNFWIHDEECDGQRYEVVE